MNNYFSHISGNDHVKEFLTHMVQKKAIGNSLLFSGPESACKDQFAIALAKILMGEGSAKKIDEGTHPDFHVYRPEGKIGMHSLASMRQFCEEVYLPPYECLWKFFLIYEADRMLTYSANALLKTFEEPATDSIIILLTSHANALLPTILSRCRVVRFLPLPYKLSESKDTSTRQRILSFFSKGKVKTYGELSKFAKDIAEGVEEIQKEEEALLKNEIQKIPTDQMNAFQKNATEKELDGAITMRLNSQAKALLRDILSWYRDLHLLHVGGRKELLENPDFESSLLQTYQRGDLLPLEIVEKKIKDAMLAIDRSTALPICLEKLFLELQLL